MWEWLSLANDTLLHFATSFQGTPWLFVFLFLFIALDGILPIFPSESLVIGTIALAISVGSPNVWLVGAIAVAGALTGDLTAYSIGRAIGNKDFAVLRRSRIAKVVLWAERMVRRRAAPVIISARYIPVGRVIVNLTAGRIKFPPKAFLVLATIAAITWSLYSSLIGVGAGHWLEGHAFLAVVAGVLGGVIMGVIVDHVLRRILDFNQKRGHEMSERMQQLDAVTGQYPTRKDRADD